MPLEPDMLRDPGAEQIAHESWPRNPEKFASQATTHGLPQAGTGTSIDGSVEGDQSWFDAQLRHLAEKQSLRSLRIADDNL